MVHAPTPVLFPRMVPIGVACRMALMELDQVERRIKCGDAVGVVRGFYIGDGRAIQICSDGVQVLHGDGQMSAAGRMNDLPA